MYNPINVKYAAIIYYKGKDSSIKSYVSNMNDNRLDLENDVRAAESSLTRSGFTITEVVYMERYNFEK